MDDDKIADRQSLVASRQWMEAKFDGLYDLMKANDRNYTQRFESMAENSKNGLEAAAMAVIKAEAAAEKRFDGLNEFRAAMRDQQATFATKAEVDIKLTNIAEKIDALSRLVNSQSGRGIGIGQGVGYVVGITGLVTGIVMALLKLIG